MKQIKTVKYTEVCPHCEEEGEYDVAPVVTCTNCGTKILGCNMCKEEQCSGCTVDSPNFELHPDAAELADIDPEVKSQGHMFFDGDTEYVWSGVDINSVMIVPRSAPIDKKSGTRFPLNHFCGVEDFKCVEGIHHKLGEGYVRVESYDILGRLLPAYMCAECHEEQTAGKSEEYVAALDAGRTFGREIERNDLYFVMDSLLGESDNKVLVVYDREREVFEINVNGTSVDVGSDFITKMSGLLEELSLAGDDSG